MYHRTYKATFTRAVNIKANVISGDIRRVSDSHARIDARTVWGADLLAGRHLRREASLTQVLQIFTSHSFTHISIHAFHSHYSSVPEKLIILYCVY